MPENCKMHSAMAMILLCFRTSQIIYFYHITHCDIMYTHIYVLTPSEVKRHSLSVLPSVWLKLVCLVPSAGGNQAQRVRCVLVAGL